MDKRLGNKPFGDDEDSCDCSRKNFFQISSYFGDEGKVFSIVGRFPHCTDKFFGMIDGFEYILYNKDAEPGPFVFVLNSIGGELNAMYTLLDALGTLRSPIYMVAHCAQSAAAVLFIAGGTRGKRFVYPNASIMLHNPHYGGFTDGIDKIELEDSVIPRWCEIIDEHCDVNTILARRARSKAEYPSEDATERRRAFARLLILNQNFTAQQAIEFGIADQMVTPEIAQDLFAPKLVEVPKRRRKDPVASQLDSLLPQLIAKE